MSLTITINEAVPATLTVSVGTPGATGATGPAGQGVPAGGLTAQFLQKTSNTSYATDWVTLPAYLPLAGGTMNVNAAIDFSDTTTGTVSEVGGYGFAVSSASNGNLLSNVLFDRVFVKNATSTTTLKPTGVEFPDLTLQTTAGLSPATAAATYQTLAGMSSYLTTSAAASTYYLQTNPSGFITSSALTPYLLSSTAASTYQTLAGMSSYLTTATAATTYAPIAAGLPTGGTVGQVLTKNSGTNFDASFATLIPGDRYLTSSTTSLTINNANKTLTVGTGLSYTPTQNITISYDAAHHMHGEVLTYDSGTGVLTVDINNHTGTGTYASWVVNVGGVTPATSVAWGAITGTLGDQTDLATALNNKLEVSTAASTYYLQTNPSGFIGDAPSDGSTYGRNNGAWAVAGGGGGVPEAPQDNYFYGRINAAWIRIPGVSPLSPIATGVSSIASWYVLGGSVFLGGTGTVLADAPASFTTLSCYGNAGAVLDISGCTSLTSLLASAWGNVGTLPSSLTSINFSNCTFTTPPTIPSSMVYGGFTSCDITTGPNFSSFTSLISVSVTSNGSMTTPPTFTGCSSLNEVLMTNNTAMTTAPSFSSAVVNQINISGCTSMTTYPTFSGTALNNINASNCAISDCNSFGSNIYSNAVSNGQYFGYFNISGGTNEAFDSTALPSWIGDLQAMSWTVVYNSY